MLVHTYHQPVPGMADATRLIALWKKHWEKNGFQTRVLTEADARAHPGYSYFLERISRFPTSNPPAYERACFLRHLAMANVGGGILTDYDVILRIPAEKNEAAKMPPYPVLLEPTRVPCAVQGTAKAYEDLCDILCEYDPAGERHVSDMTILRKTTIMALGVCVEHLCSGRPVQDDPGDQWRQAPMIHFSNYSFSKLGWTGDKATLIERVLKTL